MLINIEEATSLSGLAGITLKHYGYIGRIKILRGLIVKESLEQYRAIVQPNRRGRPRIDFAQWQIKSSSQMIISGLEKGLTEQAIADQLGRHRATISVQVKKFAKELGLMAAHRYRSARLTAEVKQRREERLELVAQLNSGNLEHLIENKICPPHFRLVAEACRQSGLSFGLVTNQKSFEHHLEGGGEENFKQTVSSFLVKINNQLCRVYYSGRSYYTGKSQRTPLWHFAVSKLKIRQCHSVILICGNGEIFTVPVKRFRRFHRRKLVHAFVPVNRMVKTPGGRGEQLSCSYWFRFAGFPKSWLS